MKVEGERIVRISRLGERDPQTYDFGGKLVLPGLIDMHVHLRDFDLSYKEDIKSGTSAAAAGGFVAVADMPNTKPRVDSLEVLKWREEIARQKALVDYGFYVGVGRLEGTEKLALGLKVFMPQEYYSGQREKTLRSIEYAEGHGMLTVVHAEDPSLGETPEAEAHAIREICGLGLRRLHITHVSSRAGHSQIRGATCDTCPHYLLLGGSSPPHSKVHPSIKGREDSEYLLQAVRRGGIQAISSDHAPHLPEEKAEGAAGFPGLETSLPLLLTLVNKGELSLERLVSAMAEQPARILGLKRLGSLEEGKYASFTVVDLKAESVIRPEEFRSKSKLSPFEGWKVRGLPVATFVRGKPVMLEEEVVGEPGWGKNLKFL